MTTLDDRKRAALREIIRHPEKSFWEVAKDYGIPDSTLYRLRATVRPLSLNPDKATHDDAEHVGAVPVNNPEPAQTAPAKQPHGRRKPASKRKRKTRSKKQEGA